MSLSGQDLPPSGRKTEEYPLIVVRTHSCNYQREPLALEKGPAHIKIGYRTSLLAHPEVDPETRTLSADARIFLENGVLAAVRRTDFRMCIVWGVGDCSYVERDGNINPSASTPSLGMRIVTRPQS